MKFNGSAWTFVGGQGFSQGAIGGVSIKIHPSGNPYVAFIDNANGNKATVMGFNGANWVTVGSAGFSPGAATSINMCVNSSSIIYVGFADGANGNKGTVMSYNGTAWSTVGPAGFTGVFAAPFFMTLDGFGFPIVSFGANSGTVMSYNGTIWSNVGAPGMSPGIVGSLICAMDQSNTPYIFYADQTAAKMKVKKYNGSSWITIGTSDIPSIWGIFPSMIIDNTSAPVVAYRGISNRAEVFRFNGQSWDRYGTRGYSDITSDCVYISVDNNNTPYSVFVDGANNYLNAAVVKRFVNNVWSAVGNSFTPSSTIAATGVTNTSMTFNSQGTPYVVLCDKSQAKKVYVRGFFSNTWQDVGVAGVSDYGADWPTIVKDASDTLYVGYMDASNFNKGMVRKFNGTTWVNVGSGPVTSGSAYFTSLAISPANVLYLAYSDGTTSNKITVKKFNGTGWVTVGTPGMSPGDPDLLQIITDKNGVPYVAYREASVGYKPTIMSFNGSNWIVLSSTGLTTASVTNISMAFDSSNNLHVLYDDGSNNGKAVVKKFTGSSWVTVGTDLYTASGAYHPVLAIDGNDAMYTAFSADGAFAYKTSFTPSVSLSNTPCVGNNIILMADGGTSYVWSGPNGFISSYQNPQISGISFSNSGIYSVTINSGSCSATNTLNVNVSANPTISVNSTTLCSGLSLTLSASGAATYTFSGGQVVTPSVSMSYSVVGTNSVGCQSAAPAIANVTIVPSPTVSATGGVICSGESYTLTPAGASSYTFSSGSAVVSPTTSTTFSITGENSFGCFSPFPATVNVTVNPSPSITVSNGTICSGQSYTINASGANSYTFSSGSAIVSPLSTTNYSVIGSTSAGCVSQTTAVSQVNVNPLPVVNVNNASICIGQSFTIVPSGANSYSFSSGSSIVSPSTTTSYSVIGTSSAGCLTAAPATLTVIVNPNPVVSVSSGSICSGQSFFIVPTGANTFTVSGNSFTVNPTATNSYSIFGTDVNGCVTQSPAICTVTVYNLPNITVNSSPSLICVGQSATLTSSGALTYTWNTTANSSSIVVTPSAFTTYTVSGSNAFGCVNSSTISQQVSSCTGVNKVDEAATAVSLYPNPFLNCFTLESQNDISFVIYNCMGQVIFTERTTCGKTSIDLQQYPPGIYWVRLNGQSTVYKVVKE